MPGDRDVAADLARALTDLYASVATQLAADIARRIAAGHDSPAWADEKLRALHTLRAWTQNVLRQLEGESSAVVAQTLVLAFVRGSTEALDAIAGLQLTPEQRAHLGRQRSMLARIRAAAQRGEARAAKAAIDAELQQVKDALPGVHGLMAMMWALESTLSGTHMPLLRWTLDSYRTVVTRAAVLPVMGLAGRRRAAQVAWEQLIADGVTGFTDRRGRRWELASYVEMATRTVVHQALRSGRLDQLLAAGHELIRISDSPQECQRCRPWENAVLRIAGSGVGRIEVEHATRDGVMVPVEVKGTLPEAIAAGLFHPNCFPGDVLVSAPSAVVAADARWYEGPLVVIHTAGGDELPVTPNHPVLTPEGWVPAGALNVGQHVLRYRVDIEPDAEGGPHDQQVPARIGDVFDALREASPVPAVRVPVAPEQFHGDGVGGDVDVVLADRLLGYGPGDAGGQGQLLGGRVGAGALLATGPALQVLDGADHAAHGVVGGGGEGLTLCRRHAGGAALGGLAGADGDPALPDPSADAGLADAESGREVVLTLAGQVEADEVVHLGRREFAGHVYNLQTGDGWYVAGGLVVHNCTHSLSLYLPGVSRERDPDRTDNPEGYADRVRLRELERKLRKAKRQAAAVIDPSRKAAADAKVRAAQAAIREHIRETGLLRQRHREQIGQAR